MTTTKRKSFKQGEGYSKQDWDDVSDNPAWTKAEIAKSKSFGELFPALDASIKRSRGRPTVATPKAHVSLRLDQDVLDKFKSTGKGWQSRINEALKVAKV